MISSRLEVHRPYIIDDDGTEMRGLDELDDSGTFLILQSDGDEDRASAMQVTSNQSFLQV